jgi:hypothetical protein
MIDLITDGNSSVSELYHFVSSVVASSDGTWRTDSKSRPIQIWTPGHVEGSTSFPKDTTYLWQERHTAMQNKGYTALEIDQIIRDKHYVDADGLYPAASTSYKGGYYQFRTEWGLLDMEQWLRVFLAPTIINAILSTKILINKFRLARNHSCIRVCDIVVAGDQRPLVAKVMRWNLEVALRGATPDRWRGTTSGEGRMHEECSAALLLLGSSRLKKPSTEINGKLMCAEWVV